MPHNRTPKPGSKYYIPKYRYKTVVNFCLQYRELKEELNTINGFHSGGTGNIPRGSSTSDPTSQDGMRRAEIEKKIEIIEKTVKEHSGILAPYLLKGITEEEITYTYLRTKKGMPLNHKEYSFLRRKIYYHISKKI